MRTVCKHSLLAGGVLQREVAAPQWLRYPAISPDGRSIAFSADGSPLSFGSSRLGKHGRLT